MRESLWLYPLAGVLHVIAIGLLLGSIVAFDVRVLSVAGTVPLRDAARWLLPIARTGSAAASMLGWILVASAGRLIAYF